ACSRRRAGTVATSSGGRENSNSEVSTRVHFARHFTKLAIRIIQSPSLPHMTILKAHFPSGADFLARYLPELGEGGIFFPTRVPLAIGEHVVVAVRLGRRRSPTLIRGQVAWRRPGKHSTKVKAGIGIQFLTTDSQARDYLLAVGRRAPGAMGA